MIRIATPKPAPGFLFAYSGREHDGDLQFNQLRHYDPTVGRFISEEPAGCEANDTDPMPLRFFAGVVEIWAFAPVIGGNRRASSRDLAR